jgi:cytochrome c556
MIRTLRVGTLALLVACMVSATAPLAVYADKDDDKKEAEKKEKIKKAGEAVQLFLKGAITPQEVVKTNDMEFVMYAFKPHEKGGLGKGNGFELRIRDFASKKAPSNEALEKETPELVRLALVSKAIAELVEAYPVPPKAPGKDPKEWVQLNKTMKQSSADLIEAIKSGKGDEVKRVDTLLNNACFTCHKKFRDG